MKINFCFSNHLSYFLVTTFDENSAFFPLPWITNVLERCYSNSASPIIFACSINSLQQNQEKMRWQSILLFRIASFTEHWIKITRFGFASWPDVGRSEWNCKTVSTAFGIVLECRPRCFLPEVLKKQNCTKNYQTLLKCSVNNSGLLQ